VPGVLSVGAGVSRVGAEVGPAGAGVGSGGTVILLGATVGAAKGARVGSSSGHQKGKRNLNKGILQKTKVASTLAALRNRNREPRRRERLIILIWNRW